MESTPFGWELLFPLEFLALHFTPAYYGLGIPHGDGSAVVLIPGLAGLDEYMLEMYLWLDRIGYRPYFSGVGLMADCPQRLTQKVYETIGKAFVETGRRVHIIGHSLGGIFARSAAVRWPEQVASVITLGSPFRGLVAHKLVFTIGGLVQNLIHQRDPKLPAVCGTSRCCCSFGRSLTRRWPKSVRQTAVFSAIDGLVDWRYCLTGKKVVDIEVQSSHLGMVINPEVYEQIARRLVPAVQTRSGAKPKPRTKRSHKK